MLKIGDKVRIRSLEEIDRKPKGSWVNELFENCICAIVNVRHVSGIPSKYILRLEKETSKIRSTSCVPEIKFFAWEEDELEKL